MNTSIYKDIKMKISMIGRVKNMAWGMALALLSMSGTATAQDEAVNVSPAYVLFPDTTTGVQSDAATITLTNNGYPGGMTVGSIILDGPHSADFNLSSDNCSAQLLAENVSCALQVNFAPRSSGIKGAMVAIPYGTGDDRNLSVYLTNQEGTEHEVQRRLSPVMYDLNIPEEMNASSVYDIDWTAMGYHSGYTSIVVMFDCTGIAAGECGASYGSPGRFHESTFLSPARITQGDWTYNGETLQNFRYDYTFNVDATRPNGEDQDAVGTAIVIRFYIKSDEDATTGKSSLSLIIPGNLSNDYYDTSGRKIQKIICPSGGCTP